MAMFAIANPNLTGARRSNQRLLSDDESTYHSIKKHKSPTKLKRKANKNNIKNKSVYDALCSLKLREECPLLTIFVLYTFLTFLFALLGGMVFHVTEYEFENTQILQKRELYNQIYNALQPQHQYQLNSLLKMCDIPMDIERNRWGLEKATFFAFTTASTIGYGYTTPQTTWGRIATFVYGFPAIILFGLSMVQIGHAIVNKIDRGPSRIVRFGLNYIKCALCCLQCKCNDCSKELKRTLFIFLMLMLLIGVSSWLLTKTETAWTIYDASYFMWISISTIGYGDLEPDVIQSSYWANGLIWLGLALTAILIGSAQDYFHTKVQRWSKESRIREKHSIFNKRIKKRRDKMRKLMTKNLELTSNDVDLGNIDTPNGPISAKDHEKDKKRRKSENDEKDGNNDENINDINHEPIYLKVKPTNKFEET